MECSIHHTHVNFYHDNQIRCVIRTLNLNDIQIQRLVAMLNFYKKSYKKDGTLRDPSKRAKAFLRRSLKMITDKLPNKSLDDTKSIIYTLLYLRRKEYPGMDYIISDKQIKEYALKKVCDKFYDIETKCIVKIKEMLNITINSVDVCNLIVIYVYPCFLPTEGGYSTNTELVYKDGFKIVKLPEKLIYSRFYYE